MNFSPIDQQAKSREARSQNGEDFMFTQRAESLIPLVAQLYDDGLTEELDAEIRPIIDDLEVARVEALAAIRGTYKTIPAEQAGGRGDAVWALAHLEKLTGTLRAVIDQIVSDEPAYTLVSRRQILSAWATEDGRAEQRFSLMEDLERTRKFDGYIEHLGIKRSDNNTDDPK